MNTQGKYLAYLAITAVVGIVGVSLALRPTPSLLTTTPHATTTEEAAISVSLSVENKTYEARIESNASVLDLMNELEGKGAFSFSGKEFPSLGFFVEEMNGKKSADGHYWILYVNGTTSQTGVSQTFLSAGDVIEWRYEKGY